MRIIIELKKSDTRFICKLKEANNMYKQKVRKPKPEVSSMDPFRKPVQRILITAIDADAEHPEKIWDTADMTIWWKMACEYRHQTTNLHNVDDPLSYILSLKKIMTERAFPQFNLRADDRVRIACHGSRFATIKGYDMDAAIRRIKGLIPEDRLAPGKEPPLVTEFCHMNLSSEARALRPGDDFTKQGDGPVMNPPSGIYFINEKKLPTALRNPTAVQAFISKGHPDWRWMIDQGGHWQSINNAMESLPLLKENITKHKANQTLPYTLANVLDSIYDPMAAAFESCIQYLQDAEATIARIPSPWP